jgi:formylmethanofuran dehydrogenase subunit E
VYVGESSRSIYEMAKEHVANREKQAEDSHQIKHWITSHEELLAPPKFVFKIIKTSQDPPTRQLSEAVRIDLRGEDILNSKAEYSRCRVP